MLKIFNGVIDNVWESITDTLCDFINDGSSDRLVKSLAHLLIGLEEAEIKDFSS